jgi:CRP-like cAMP-binding protein
VPPSSAQKADFAGNTIQNKLLLSLSDEAFALVRPHLDFVDLPFHYILRGSGDPVRFVCFLNKGMTSLIIATENGNSAEVGVVGKEGMTGAPSVAGLTRTPIEEMMQIAGNGLRIDSKKLQGLGQQRPELHSLFTRYAVLQGMQIAQIAGCNRLHSAEQRLARWLLMTHDRTEFDSLPLTQEFLTILLGTTRSYVSIAAGALQKKGAIKYERQSLRIVNRKRLERVSCECYRILARLTMGSV